MKSLAVRVLGDFGVDGLAPHALGSRKARQALHLLALGQGRRVSTDVLIDALWASVPPARPEDQLSVLVSRLRSVLGGRERIGLQDGGYLLHYDWLDAAELASLIDEVTARREAGNVAGAAAAARVALSLVRGPGPATAAPGEWAAQRQAELTRLAGRARRVAAQLLLEAGDWATAADAATSALDQDPYDESALRLLLRAYAAGGQLAAALAAYASTRERLADELGTGPAPETVALHTAILRGERPGQTRPAPAGPATHTGSQSRIVGRDDELGYLDTVAGRARGGRTEILIVEGEAGIGKTTLLRSWAARRAAAGDTILLAPCGPLDRSMPLDALLTALATLLRRSGPETAATLLDADAAILAPLLDTAAAPGQLTQLSQLTGLVDSMLGPAVLYAALTRVLRRLTEAGTGPLVAVIDDAHLAGPALADLLRFAARQDLSLAVVAAVRTGEGVPLPATARIQLTALTRAAVEELVGPGRAARLYDRSKGHPLFLTELAQQAAAAELPASLVESVSARCDELGPAGSLLRTAAVIGPELDVDLLAALSGRGVVDVLDDAAQAADRQFLAEDGGVFRFRHELVREALAASASAGRAALLHRQAGRVLARRPGADPATVAGHARLGGDVALASAALCDAAGRAAERFDHAAAEALLDDAVRLDPRPEAWLARARVRTRRGDYDAALRDVDRAATAAAASGSAGPAAGAAEPMAYSSTTEGAARAAPATAAALEVGAWASYFGRRFTQAAQFAADGALAASDVPTRARCLAVGGRIRHAAGDLATAETLLGEALTIAAGADRVTAAAWLGVLRAHQSRVPEALELLRPAARGQIGVEHTSATLHALLFLGHAHALAGQPQLALDAFGRYTAEVERRQVPRFAGRGVNFSGWVLRSLGATREAEGRHAAALDIGRGHGTAELTIAALEDLAEQALDDGDPDRAADWLAQASDLLQGDIVFGWRLDLKRRLLAARLALLCGDPEQAAAQARDLERRAQDLALPRYVSVARLVRHRASVRLGQPARPQQVEADLDLLDSSVAIEAWWWTGDLAADYGIEAWLDRSARHVTRLSQEAGPRYASGLQAAARQRMAGWRSRINGQRPAG